MSFENSKNIEQIENIKNAAVQFRDLIFEGTTHGHAYGKLLEYIKRSEPQIYKNIVGG